VYLADAGYVGTEKTLTPYRQRRYHLVEFGGGSAEKQPQNKEELFNLRHSSLCIVVKRAFSVLQGRFKMCTTVRQFSVKKQVDLVYVLAALHNWINRYNPTEPTQEELQMVNQSLRERNRTWLADRQQQEREDYTEVVVDKLGGRLQEDEQIAAMRERIADEL